MSHKKKSERVYRVVMSEKVAHDYIGDITEEGYTLTVYSSNGESLNSFLDEIQKKEYSDKISSVQEGFDFITVLTKDSSTLNSLKKLAVSNGLQTSGF